ncbi:MAG: DUF1707 domain-containing protein [Longimicrobiales bacterium]|nr:DUF1707 domain-containing protein [Longimicrobiales bacterium]
MRDAGSGGTGGRGSVTDAERDATVDVLADAFAADAMDVEEFERRVELVQRAASAAELDALLRDLPRERDLPTRRTDSSGRPVGRRDRAWEDARPGSVTLPPPASHVPHQAVVIGVLGGGVRRGRWHPARYNYAVGVLGGAELDFRECALPPVTDVRCFAVMGGVEVLVPPGVVVECSGVGILGGFEHVADAAEPPEGAPVIRITGVAMMGGVEVSVRHPGETAREAKRRRKEERREQRRLRDGT